MIIAWQLFKLASGQLLAFIMKHWRIILIALVLGYCYLQYNKQANRADEAEANLAKQVQIYNEYLKQVEIKTAERKASDAVKIAVAKKSLEESEKQHLAQIEKLNLNRKRETQNLKDLYENRFSNFNATYANGLRDTGCGKRDDAGLSEDTRCAVGSAESERDCDTGYSILEKACKLTTIDYNRLRAWADTACEQVGCE